MPFNMQMLTSVIAAPSEPEMHEPPTNPILLAHRGVARHAPENTLHRYDLLSCGTQYRKRAFK